jgi:hypothetical protein
MAGCCQHIRSYGFCGLTPVSATRFWPRPIAVATFSGAEPPWHRILGTTNLPYSCNRTRTLVERRKTSKKKKRKKRRRSLYRNKISTAVKRLRGLCHLCATRFWIRPIPKGGIPTYRGLLNSSPAACERSFALSKIRDTMHPSGACVSHGRTASTPCRFVRRG